MPSPVPVLLALLALLLSGCMRGTPEPWSQIESMAPRPASWEAAVGVRHMVVREPRGILRFPDGGSPRILEQELRVFLIDARDRRVVRRVVLPAPDALRSSFRGTLLGWRGDTLLVVLSGCPGRECHGAQVERRVLALSPEGVVLEAGPDPGPLDPVPGSMVPLPGESHPVRYSTDGSTVRVWWEDAFVPAFRLTAEGDLTALGDRSALGDLTAHDDRSADGERTPPGP